MPTKMQWMKICLDGLGLRSASSEADTRGASYALDDGSGYTLNADAPGDWDKKLAATLEQILGFSNASGRKLLLVKGVRGTSADYAGCFQKCSSHPSGVVASTDLSAQTVSSLTEWILRQI
ncbi:MAG: hypothetical protein IPK82_29480 [Polyangiaceae bacterium]|nr:hypothetical protein [Polyangiaceae bacterium]